MQKWKPIPAHWRFQAGTCQTVFCLPVGQGESWTKSSDLFGAESCCDIRLQGLKLVSAE